MRLNAKNCAILLGIVLGATAAYADNEFLGGSGSPLNIWSEPSNWQDGAPPASATDSGMDFTNVGVIVGDGIEMLIDSSVNATAFGLQIGKQANPPLGTGSASSNTLNMTGGTLTVQGNFLFNVGRGRNFDPNQVVAFNMSGGLVNASGITVPEQFSVEPGNLPITANMSVSGDSVINADLLRVGAQNSISRLTVSDNAQINLTDDNMGFAPGTLWIKPFASDVDSDAFVDIRDDAIITVHGEWFTDENGDGERGRATETEAQYYRDNYQLTGLIGGDGVPGAVSIVFDPTDEVISIFVPEPAGLVLWALALPLVVRLVRRR